MSKATRTIVGLVVSLVLFSAITMAQAGGNTAEKDKNNKEHHSSLAKAAFWRHHKDADKNAKRAQASEVPSKQAQAKTAQVKPVSAKQAAKKDPKQEQHASNVSKPSTKKAPVANKTRPRQKAQDAKTTSLK